MPPKGSGVSAEQEKDAQKVAISYLAAELASRKLVVCLPWLPGGTRKAGGPLGKSLEQTLLDGVAEAVNAMRAEQQLGEWKAASIWRSVLRPLEETCKVGDPDAFQSVAGSLGVDVAQVRPTRTNAAHVTLKENVTPQHPPPPPPPPPPATPGSPPRKGLSPSRILASSSTTAVSTGTPTFTRAAVSRVAMLEANTVAAEQAAAAITSLDPAVLQLLGGKLSGGQVGSILSGFVSTTGSAQAVIDELQPDERAQLVSAALRNPAAVRSALRALLQLESDPSVPPPTSLPAMVQSAIPKLNESELLDVLDVLAHSLMSEVRSRASEVALPRARARRPPACCIATALCLRRAGQGRRGVQGG